MSELSPLEINKKIAEIKEILPEFQSGEIYVNWSENIYDAWQLFEENYEVYIKKMKFSDGQICYECVYRDDNLNVIGQATAETAPLAICKAYLKFKGVE